MNEQAAPVPAPPEPRRKVAKKEHPTKNPDLSACNHYLPMKHRFCRTKRRAGSGYCHTHAGERPLGAPGDASGGRPEDPRVPCPINPKHTVYASRLAKHITVCPDLRFVTTNMCYYAADRHADRGVPRLCGPAAGQPRLTHRDLSPEELAALTAKIDACYETAVAGGILDLQDLAVAAPCGLGGSGVSESDSDGEGDGGGEVDRTRLRSKKHGPQHSALLQCLDFTLAQAGGLGSCGPGTVRGFVELGAGKGGLSLALQRLLASHREPGGDPAEVARLEEASPFLKAVSERPRVAVVDMDGFRRKGDATVNRSAIPIERVRINIKDLDLSKALVADERPKKEEEGENQWIALGKHLCGACTDFALSCVIDANGAASGCLVPAVVVATCCHHRCELRHLNPPARGAGEGGGAPGVGLPATDYSFTEREFAAMTSMTSWAVCGDFVDSERCATGYQCKRIIDALRVAFLEASGFHARQCRYTTTNITGENVCILAWRGMRQ